MEKMPRLTTDRVQNTYPKLMEHTEKPNIFKQLLQQKAAKKAQRAAGIIGDSDLARRFQTGEKPQPIIRRGGRNGSGKP